jgi:hypothetical protein
MAGIMLLKDYAYPWFMHSTMDTIATSMMPLIWFMIYGSSGSFLIMLGCTWLFVNLFLDPPPPRRTSHIFKKTHIFQ